MKPTGNTHDRKWLKPLAGLLAGATLATVAFAPSANAAPINAVAEDSDSHEYQLSPEQEAVWNKFDKCLEDAGVDVEKLYAFSEDEDDSEDFELGDTDDPKVDAAFDKCEKILDELPSGDDEEAIDNDEAPAISDEDQAVYDKFDKCLSGEGVDVEQVFNENEDAEIDAELDARLDDAFDKCESILDELSTDGFTLSAEEQAEYDKFDKCLSAEGITDAVLDSEGDDTPDVTARIDAAFEKCDSTLND